MDSYPQPENAPDPTRHRFEVYHWTDEVPLFGEYAFCLQRILEEEGILPEDE